jgi:transposase
MNSERQRLNYEVVRRRVRGESIHGINRALGVSRKTIRRILREMDARRSAGDNVLTEGLRSRRAPRPSKLDRYAQDIEALVTQYPDIHATRLHEELVARGFDGGYTIVREYLKRLRAQKKPPKDSSVLVVTSPGRQAQVDWSTYALADGTPYYAFSFILCHSRYQYMAFLPDMRQTTLFRQLRLSLEKIGGVVEEVVFDSMPTVVDRWEFDQPILNLRAVDFAAYYGFSIHIAPRAQGQYKGKVERRFRHLEGSLLNARTFYSLTEANEKLVWWLSEHCNQRVHSRTKKRPIDLLPEDQAALHALPAHPYDDRDLAFCLVDGYGYVNFDGNHYKAEGQAVGNWVYLRASDDEVAIFSSSVERVQSYQRHARNSGIYDPAPLKDRRPRRHAVAELVQCFAGWGPVALQFAQAVQKRQHHAGLELSRILSLRERYAAEDILHAIEHSNRYAAYSARSVERVLQVRAKPLSVGDMLAARTRERIKNTMAAAIVGQRPLAAYQYLLKGPATSQSIPVCTQENTDDEEEEKTGIKIDSGKRVDAENP